MIDLIPACEPIPSSITTATASRTGLTTEAGEV